MSFQSLLSMKCNIHKVKQVPGTGVYGLPAEDVFTYDETPDFTDIPCYYELTRGKAFGDVERKDTPGARLNLSIRIYFPINAQVELSDLVFIEGHYYRLDLPKKVMNHHLEVYGAHYQVVFGNG